MPRGTTNFLLWCDTHGIEIDERLEIRESVLDGSMSVFSKSDAIIPIGETLVRIPKASVFSVKNCSRSRDIPAGKHDAGLELSLAFIIESLLGSESPWRGYFSCLPTDCVDIALFWGLSGERDGVEAKEWLEGTEAGKISSLALMNAKHHIDAYFERVAKEVLRHLQLPISLEYFHRAYSIISSRAFLVDAYHGLCLVPVADAFNHIEDNHIHLESDYYVCPTCGSLDECGHDSETPFKSPNVACKIDDTCEMVTNLPIMPGKEVFNSYQKGLTNAELLCQYGFILDVNENDTVSWSVEELRCDETQKLWAELISLWPSNPGWEETQLVFNSKRGEDGVPAPHGTNSSLLTLNADGQISHYFWLLLYTLVRSDANVGTIEALLEVQQIARLQERIEGSLTSEVTTLDPCSLTLECRGPLNLLRRVAQKVIQICDAKAASAHCAGMAASQIGKLLDDMPSERRLTRLAMSYALEERTMLEACRGAWSEFAGR